MSKLIKNYIYNIIYQIFLMVVPLITAPYLSRVLSSKSLGIYSYINSVVSIITILGMIGLNSYGYRQIAYDKDESEKVSYTFSTIFYLRVILIIIITILYIPFSYFSEYKKYLLIQYILIFSQFIDISWVFIGYEDLKIVTVRNFVAKLLTVISIFIFVKRDEDLWKYFFIFAIITFITTISIFSILKKYVNFMRVKFNDIFIHIYSTIKLFIPQIAVTLYLQFDKVMLKQLTDSMSQVAYYEYAEKIILIPLAIITALNNVMMPRIANLYIKNNIEKISEYMKITLKSALFLGVPMMFGLMAISENFIPWYLGNEYINSAYAIVVLSPLCILNIISSIFGSQYLTAVNETKILTISYYSAAVANLIFNFILIPRLEYLGAALATVISSASSVLIQYIYIRKRISFNSLKIDIIKSLLSGSIMFILIKFLTLYLKISPINTILEVILGIGIYIFFNIILKNKILFYIISKGLRFNEK